MSNVCKALLNRRQGAGAFYFANATLQAYHFCMSENLTRPALDTLLARINAIGEEMRTGFTAINVRLDRIESLTSTTRGEMLSMRADFTEMQNEFRELRAGLKQAA